jgi:ribosome-binding factor A
MQITNRSIDFPGWVHFFIITILIGALFSANPFLTVFSIAVIIFLTKLLWKKGEPPVLLFIVFIQWLQASTKILHANIYNAPLTTFSSIKHIEEAIFLSLTGIIILGIAMNLAVRKMPPLNFIEINNVARRLNLNKLMRLYFISLIVVLGLSFIRSLVPALSQIILAIQNIKWIIIFILVVSSIVKREKSIYVFLIFGIDRLFCRI